MLRDGAELEHHCTVHKISANHLFLQLAVKVLRGIAEGRKWGEKGKEFVLITIIMNK